MMSDDEIGDDLDFLVHYLAFKYDIVVQSNSSSPCGSMTWQEQILMYVLYYAMFSTP
jgi:hypothetical protein